MTLRERWSDLSPSHRSVVVLALGVAVALWTGTEFLDLADDLREGDTDRFDDAVLRWLATHRSAIATTIFLALTALGSWPVLTVLSIGTCIATLLAGERRFSLTLMVTMAGVPFLALALKSLYDRERPTIVPHLETVANPSFPSGHTIGSVAFFVTVALPASRYTARAGLRVFLIVYALLIGALVAISRMYLGVHYPSDVAGGALIGIAWAFTCVVGERLLHARASSSEDR